MNLNIVNEPNPRTGNLARVRRYRAKCRRIDYVPAADVLAIIERHKAQGLDNCLAGVIDRLVRAGDKGVSGNGRGTQRNALADVPRACATAREVLSSA